MAIITTLKKKKKREKTIAKEDGEENLCELRIGL